MKKGALRIIVLIMALALALALCACGGDDTGAAADADAADVQEETGETEEAEAIDTSEIVKTIDEIDTEDMNDLPLQIESITLFEDGSVMIIPTEDLLRNAETNDELVDGAMYPFEESGKVQDMYLVRFGNGGYRTLICLMDDGSLSAMSGKELIEDHIAVVMDNMSGRDNYVSVEQTEDEDAFGVTGVTEDGEEVELDTILNF